MRGELPESYQIPWIGSRFDGSGWWGGLIQDFGNSLGCPVLPDHRWHAMLFDSFPSASLERSSLEPSPQANGSVLRPELCN